MKLTESIISNLYEAEDKYAVNKIKNNLASLENNEDINYEVEASFTDFPDILKEINPKDRLKGFMMLYMANPKINELNNMTLNELIDYIRETDEYYEEDKEYIDKCIELINENINESIDEGKKFNYMMLSRLKSDCDYYLGNGNRNPRNLWAGDESKQIAKMREIYNGFSDEDKPEWLTKEDIDKYEDMMINGSEDKSENHIENPTVIEDKNQIKESEVYDNKLYIDVEKALSKYLKNVLGLNAEITRDENNQIMVHLVGTDDDYKKYEDIFKESKEIKEVNNSILENKDFKNIISRNLKEESYESGIYLDIENAIANAGLSIDRYSDLRMMTKNLGWVVSNSEGEEADLTCAGTYLDEKLNEETEKELKNNLSTEDLTESDESSPLKNVAEVIKRIITECNGKISYVDYYTDSINIKAKFKAENISRYENDITLYGNLKFDNDKLIKSDLTTSSGPNVLNNDYIRCLNALYGYLVSVNSGYEL